MDKVWTHEFKSARDIIDTLRIQFAYQHRQGLLLQRRLRDAGEQRWLNVIRGQTLRLALEKPPGWEYLLFGHALTGAVDKYHYLRRRHETGIPFGLGEDVDDPMLWVAARFSDALRISGGMTVIFNKTLQDALGPPRSLETLKR